MKTAIINLYSFNELSEKSKEKAVTEHLDFLDSMPEEFEEEEGIIKKYIEHSTQEAVDSIETNEYLFYADGELAHVVQYTGKHPKAGTIELNFHGQIITL